MQYKINGYDQIIEDENPYFAASQYLQKFYNIEIAKPYATIYNGTETSDEFDEVFEKRLNKFIENERSGQSM